MGKREDVSMMRLTDEAGSQLLAACVSSGSCDLICVGEPDSFAASCKPVTSVIIDVSAAIQITDPLDLDAMAAWISAASIWLRMAQQGGEDGQFAL